MSLLTVECLARDEPIAKGVSPLERSHQNLSYDLIPQLTGYTFNPQIVYSSNREDGSPILITGSETETLMQYNCSSKVFSQKIVQTDAFASRLKTNINTLLELLNKASESAIDNKLSANLKEKYRQNKLKVENAYFQLIRWNSFALPQVVLNCKDVRCKSVSGKPVLTKYLRNLKKIKAIGDSVARLIASTTPSSSIKAKTKSLQRKNQDSLSVGAVQLKTIPLTTYSCK